MAGGITVTGLNALKRGMIAAGKRAEGAMGGAVYLEASRIMAKSVPLVPVDTGRLRGSHFVASPQRKGGDITVQLGYGADYGAPVHERHATKKKFLRIPFDDARSSARSNMAKDAARLFRENKGFGNVAHAFPTKAKLTKRAAASARRASAKEQKDPR